MQCAQIERRGVRIASAVLGHGGFTARRCWVVCPRGAVYRGEANVLAGVIAPRRCTSVRGCRFTSALTGVEGTTCARGVFRAFARDRVPLPTRTGIANEIRGRAATSRNRTIRAATRTLNRGPCWRHIRTANGCATGRGCRTAIGRALVWRNHIDATITRTPWVRFPVPRTGVWALVLRFENNCCIEPARGTKTREICPVFCFERIFFWVANRPGENGAIENAKCIPRALDACYHTTANICSVVIPTP